MSAGKLVRKRSIINKLSKEVLVSLNKSARLAKARVLIGVDDEGESRYVLIKDSEYIPFSYTYNEEETLVKIIEVMEG